MGEYSGFLVMFDEERRADLLKERTGITSGFSDTFSSPDWGMKEWEVCFLSFDGMALDHACLAQRRNKAATAKYRVEFLEFVDLLSLDLAEIAHQLPSKLEHHWLRSSSGRGRRVPPATWDELIRIVRRLRPNQAAEVDRLLRLRAAAKHRLVGPAAEQVALERDAVGVALDIFDRSSQLRQETLRRWVPHPGPLPPFLKGVEQSKLTEEQMLAHDSRILPGAEAVATQIGARFTVGERMLSVVYLNRTSVEKSLGIDLIYYNHQFEAYTLVQYKRMNKESLKKSDADAWVFRPSSDRNFDVEMKRMHKFRAENPDEWGKSRRWESFRLNGDGFFFKFCPSTTLEVLSADLIRGCYLPREYTESLLMSNVTDGSRGGKLLSFENVQRHLNNSDFATLVRDGWIGTRAKSTDLISELIRNALDGERAVVVARTGQIAESEDSDYRDLV